MELTHASFFSGVGGLDLGLERAGWRTVSFSEIDPYASAVLAERWPGVPNLGDILGSISRVGSGGRSSGNGDRHSATHRGNGWRKDDGAWRPYRDATLWSGGFPCQDLSVAGKRRGLAGERSGLAFAFLDLVERHRPPAILLENVPGLLSSHGGKDLGALLGRLGELGYWWAYRILDAQYFGVPQRRRRVFICALHAGAGFGADSAAAVLSVGARCRGHSAEGDEARTEVALGFGDRPELAGSLTRRYGKGINTTLDDGAIIVGPSPDPGGVREADGLAGRLDDRPVAALDSEAQAGHLIAFDPTAGRDDRYYDDGTSGIGIGWAPAVTGQGGMGESELLPLGLDSHRYRCCGNGVVSNVAEWIGVRLGRAVA